MTQKKPTVSRVLAKCARLLRRPDWQTWDAIEQGNVVAYRKDRRTGRVQRRDEHRRWRDVPSTTTVRAPKE